MIVYCLFLLPIAILAYFLGSMDTIVLASNFAFRRNLLRFGTGNLWLSNFRRVYGFRGFLRLLLVEVIRDLIPILFGGLVMAIKGHAEAGFAFAGFCLVFGRLYPILYDFKGGHAALCMAVAAMFINVSAGAAIIVVLAAVVFVTRHITLGTVAAAVVYAAVAVLMVDDKLLRNLALITVFFVVFKHIPSVIRILNGREEKIADIQDVTYKFDEKF